MNSDKQLTAYLCGAIESAEVDHGIRWREDITIKLADLPISTNDPCKLEKQKTGMSVGESKEKIMGWKRSGNWELFSKTMSAIRKADIALVKKSDMVIVYIEEGVAMGGTIAELTVANDKGIPIYCVLKGLKTNLNSWVLDTILDNGEVFSTFNELIAFLKDKYKLPKKGGG